MITFAVCGGRKFKDRDFVYKTLDQLLIDRGWDIRDLCLVTGDATGADDLSLDWAADRRCRKKSKQAHWNDLTQPGAVIRKRIDGSKYDARAGCRRNQRIIDEEKPILTVAFPGFKGTEDMIRRSELADIEVIRVKYNNSPEKHHEDGDLFLENKS